MALQARGAAAVAGQPAPGKSRRWTEPHSEMDSETKPQTDLDPGPGTAQAAKGPKRSAEPEWGWL